MAIHAFQDYPAITDAQIKDALNFTADQVYRYLPDFTDAFPNAYSENGFYAPIANDYWTNGFWTGMVWLAYEHTRDASFKAVGQKHVLSFLNRIEQKISVDHHDMGFLYSPSCVAAYQLIGDASGLKAAILAADQLAGRFHEKGGFIQAWGPMDAPENHRLIIDCLLNLPLLYFAAEKTGEPHYKTIADRHLKTAVAQVIRPDFSTWHTFYFDMATGAPHHGETCQGYRDDSAWARGQAWGIYGCALAYKYLKAPEYIALFEGVTDYYLRHLPKDLIPYWDLSFTDGDPQPKDSSSAAIAACGLLEMAKYVSKEKALGYETLARQMVKSLYAGYQVKDHTASNGLVQHATYSNRSPYNTCDHKGVDACNIWGDYFYMEALTRLDKNWQPYW